MSGIVFVPKLVTGYTEGEGTDEPVFIPASFSGSVTLRAPLYEERLELSSGSDFMEFMNQESKKKRDILEGKPDEEKVRPDQMKTLIAMAKWSYGFYEKIDLVRLKDGYHFQDLETMRRDSSCSPILQEIATKLSHGFELGNS